MNKLSLTIALGAALSAPAAAQKVIDTGLPGTTSVFPFGKDSDFGDIPTVVAQTFTVPGGAYFLNFVRGYIEGGVSGGSQLQLTAALYEFDGDHLDGGPIGPSFALTGTDDVSGFHAIEFGDPNSTVGIPLTPGVVYALVLSAVEGYATTPDHSTITVGATDDLYTGGSLFVSTATDLPSLQNPGAFVDAGFDAAFVATFGTPEPASVVLVASGLIALGVVARGRRRASRPARVAA